MLMSLAGMSGRFFRLPRRSSVRMRFRWLFSLSGRSPVRMRFRCFLSLSRGHVGRRRTGGCRQQHAGQERIKISELFHTVRLNRLHINLAKSVKIRKSLTAFNASIVNLLTWPSNHINRQFPQSNDLCAWLLRALRRTKLVCRLFFPIFDSY